ncbi:PAS domain S-box protein [Solidesulfovibrio sp.]
MCRCLQCKSSNAVGNRMQKARPETLESALKYIDVLESRLAERMQADDALSLTQEGLHFLRDCVSDAIFFIDAETGRLRDISSTACSLMGLSRDALIGRCQTELHPVEDREFCANQFRECVRLADEGRACRSLPVTISRADGSRITGRMAVMMVSCSGERLACCVFNSPAIHGLLGSGLQESEAYFAQTLPGAADGAWSWNPETGAVYLSRQWEAMLGYNPGEVKGTIEDSQALLHPDDRDMVLGAVGDCARGLSPSFSLEYRLRARDGSSVWVHGRGGPVRDASGRVTLLAGITTDITRRKETELALRESEERFRLLAEHSPDGIIIHDALGRILDVNERACRELGYAAAQLRRMNISDIGTTRPREELLAMWANHPLGEFSLQSMARRRDGTLYPAEIRGVVFEERGRRLFLATGRDQTERLRHEQALAEARDAAQAANRAKTEFLASMSHEIRTPMNIILGMAELLGEQAATPVQKQFVEAIESSGRMLLRLLNDILDLSRIEAEHVELRREPFSPADLVADVCRTMQVAAAQKGLDFAIVCAPGLPATVANDADRVRQVLVNLIWNAVKFTDAGRIEVRLSLQVGNDGRPCLHFAVADTGPGVAPELLARIFDPFTRSDGAAAGQYGGTGLGLGISKRLVELMGGAIAIDSVPGRGATFSFTLPVGTAATTAAAALAGDRGTSSGQAVRSSEGAAGRRWRLLVAEDSEANQELLRLFLEEEPYDITMAATGHAAVAAFGRERFDVVLMDVEMPGMCGLEASRAIRRLEAASGAAPTPLVLLTAHAFSEYEARGRAAGCDGFLTKPIRKARLLEALARLVAGGRLD